MKKPTKIMGILALLLLLAPAVIAEDHEDEGFIEAYGEEILNFGSAILSTVLFLLTFIAYKRTKNNRLVYVSLAFFLFAIKGYISAAELFVGEFDWGDPATAILEFAILLSFFWGLMKK